MAKWHRTVIDTYLNAASALVLMGATWFYLFKGTVLATYYVLWTIVRYAFGRSGQGA